VRVAATTRLSPSFVRVTFTGPELDRVAPTGRDQRIKLVLPLPDDGLDPVLMTDSWYQVWRSLPDHRRHPIRTYTMRALRPQQRELDVDVVRHGPTGPAGRWADQVGVGDEVMLYAPNRDARRDPGGIDFAPPEVYDRLLLAGDETALPAVAAILTDLPARVRGAAVLELPHGGDAAALDGQHPGVVTTVVTREERRGHALQRAVTAQLDAWTVADGSADVAPGDLDDVDVDRTLLWEVPRDGDRPGIGRVPLYAWCAGEAAVIRALRRHLVADRGIDRRCVAFLGYWREGRAEDNR
jgi:NADPH-dependent ferric siderophore reductase